MGRGWRWGAAVVAGAALVGAACARQAPAPRRAQDVALPRDSETVEARVPANATLDALLRSQQVPPTLADSIISAIRPVFDPHALRADQPYRITRTLDGLLREFEYQIDTDRLLRVVLRRKSDGAPDLTASIEEIPRTIQRDAAEADITRETPSLMEAMDAAGENVQLALALADIFGGQVDFNSDLQRGDRIDALFERVIRADQFSGYGDVLAAVLYNEGHKLTAIRYTGPDGKPGWYDEQGHSLKRAFLRSPLRFIPNPQVTSGFTYRRLHPILGYVRPHLGVDYRAGYGSPVVAVASGVVESAGWAGEAGRLIVLRHAGGYETLYMHLSAFAPGLHAGVRVEQGQTIGRVGQSGEATGPHLDFRIKKNGQYVNPLVEVRNMPAAEPLPAVALPAFFATRDRVLNEMSTRVSAFLQRAAPGPH